MQETHRRYLPSLPQTQSYREVKSFSVELLSYLSQTSPQCFVWFIILFHVALLALLVIYTPERTFQSLYNLSQKLKVMRFGWLILASVLGE